MIQLCLKNKKMHVDTRLLSVTCTCPVCKFIFHVILPSIIAVLEICLSLVVLLSSFNLPHQKRCSLKIDFYFVFRAVTQMSHKCHRFFSNILLHRECLSRRSLVVTKCPSSPKVKFTKFSLFIATPRYIYFYTFLFI